jgi:ABC-type antimicrobial peptide transport system permease subunit
MYRQYTLESLAERSMVELSFTALGLAIASVLALILGLVGLYGVLSYAVAARTREIGLHMALGAVAGQVRRMVVGQGVRVLLVGIVLGTAAAYGATRALSSLLFGVEAFDLTTYLGVSVLMVLVGFLASWVPARRASRVDPMEALRME